MPESPQTVDGLNQKVEHSFNVRLIESKKKTIYFGKFFTKKIVIQKGQDCILLSADGKVTKLPIGKLFLSVR